MKKQKLMEIFDELLAEWFDAESVVINDRGDIDEYDDLERDKEEYKKRFLEALDD